MDYQLLKNELLTDPLGLGYVSHITSGADNQLELLLNEPRNEITIPISSLSNDTIAACLVGAEMIALTDIQRDTIRVYLTPSNVDMSPNSSVRNSLFTMFPEGTQTHALLIQVLARTGSRAEQLGFYTVSSDDVAVALRHTI